MKLLVTSDIHLGVRSSSIASPHVPAKVLATTETWRRIVDLALSEDVNAVLLAGDVVHRANRFFEAYGALEEGIRRLVEAEVSVYAVSGNHDHDVFPRLVRSLGESSLFHLLGEHGRWERMEVSPGLAIHGWSFPALHVTRSPLDDYPFQDEELPCIGLLHGDLQTKDSRYGPVAGKDLQATPAMLWCLGHVHRGEVVKTGGKGILIPGSPHALDPSETGTHGPWMVEITGSTVTRLEQVPLAPVRYEDVEVELDKETPAEDVPILVAQAVKDCLTRSQDESRGWLRCLACRLLLFGRTHLHGRLDGALAYLDELLPRAGDAVAVVDPVPVLRTTTPVDLDAVARGRDPAGALARMLSGKDDDLPRDLLREMKDAVRRVHGFGGYASVAEDRAPDGAELHAILRSAAEDLLHQLLHGGPGSREDGQ